MSLSVTNTLAKAQRVGEFPRGPSLERPQCFLELGHTALKWIEVWGVRRDRQANHGVCEVVWCLGTLGALGDI